MTPPVVGVYLALGSNLGDRLQSLRTAVRRLAGHPQLCVTMGSPVFESAAHTHTPAERQPNFLNAVIKVCTALDPEAVLDILQQLERDAGRSRNGPGWEPRSLDIDVLAYGERTLLSPSLAIPHPRLGSRRFVLEPWAIIAPDFLVPAPFAETVAGLLGQCEDPGKVSVFAERLLDS